MSITKDDLHRIVDRLSESDAMSAYDYLQYLIGRKKHRTWADIAQLPQDTDSLSSEEQRQLDAPGDFITLEQAAKEYEI